ncbi:MAG: ABC transporter permease [Chloroflexi bacterium]|nr:ABC transporter permease [Chloroflexota bacterium]
MGRYIFRRAMQGLVAVFVLVTFVFLLTRLTGNPVDLLLPPEATQEDRENMIHNLGLDRSLPVQYLEFVGDAVRGDLGKSIRFQVPVSKLLIQRLPNSLRLVGFGFAFALLVGIPLGVLAGSRRGGTIDTATRFLAVVGIAAPGFWVGLVLIQVFSVNLLWLPSARMGGINHYILPGFSMSLFVIAGMTRLLRSSMIEVRDTEYIKLARIKGVSENSIIWKHSLRNSLIPVLTFSGMYLALMVGGSIVTETIFAWPGTGRLAYEGIIYRDYPLVQGVVLLHAALVIGVNFVIDIVYSWVDPRIRHDDA